MWVTNVEAQWLLLQGKMNLQSFVVCKHPVCYLMNTKIYFYLVTSDGQNSNVNLIVVYFFITSVLDIYGSLRLLLSCKGV